MEYSISDEPIRNAGIGVHEIDDSDYEEIIHSVSNAVPAEENDLPDPIDYLKMVMEKRGLRNKDMKVYIGSSGNVCSVLKRHKPLSIRMIRNLHKYLHIPADILIQPYDCH